MESKLRPLVVMGVSGAGKSTIGRAVSEAAGTVFVDGDDIHPPANLTKMAAGVPLDDDDRVPWLDAIGGILATGKAGVVACSALRRRYRDRIRSMAPDVFFVCLDGEREALASRLAERAQHFMPLSLLDSQLETLEPLQRDENGIVLSIMLPPDVIVERVLSLYPVFRKPSESAFSEN